MKKIIFFGLILNYLSLYSAVGCMAKSKHTDNCDGYDYKNYHYVYCTCNCNKYDISYDRAQCRRCGHYHNLADFPVL